MTLPEDSAGSPWPPASVWVAVGLLLVSPASLIVYAGVWPNYVLQAFGCGGLLFGIAPSLGLLLGWRSGPTGGLWYVGLFLAWLVFAGGPNIVRMLVGQLLWSPLPVVVGWAVALIVALRWPETRRWCGLLPPADPEDD